MDEFDCLVLSGGGSKGAYGAGAAKAFFAYRKAKNIKNPLVFVGTSAGALNACVLAAHGPDKLYDLWAKLTPSAALGWPPRDPRARAVLNSLSPVEWFRIVSRIRGYDLAYRLYSPSGLKKLITEVLSDIDFEEFRKNAHLVIAATDYTRGEMAAFYISGLIDEFRKTEELLPIENRSLGHFIPIDSRDMLINALLASAAIPIAFPPVKINGAYYVDGGIGNNTPTREAAMFLRYLNDRPEISKAKAGRVFTVLQQPPGTLILGNHRLGVWGLAGRTYELFHYTQMLPVILGWHQINRSAERHAARASGFNEFLDGIDMAQEAKDTIRNRFNEDFASIRGRATSRQSLPMIEVQPTNDLGSFLDFNTKVVATHIGHGYTGMIHTLFNRELIQAELRDDLLTQVRDPLGSDIVWEPKKDEPESQT